MGVALGYLQDRPLLYHSVRICTSTRIRDTMQVPFRLDNPVSLQFVRSDCLDNNYRLRANRFQCITRRLLVASRFLLGLHCKCSI